MVKGENLQSEKVVSEIKNGESFILELSNVRNIIFAGACQTIFFKDGSSVSFFSPRKIESSLPGKVKRI